MDMLPKELRLLVCKKLDIEGRIKLGMIGKLKIPISMRCRMEYCLQHAVRHRPKTTTCCVSLHVSGGKYYSCFYDTAEEITYWYFTNSHIPVRKCIYKMKC